MPFDDGMGNGKRATLYREVIDARTCPLGLKAKALLERHGYSVDDHWLRTRHQADAFMRRYGVDRTPQVFIDGRRVGDYDALRVHLGEPREPAAVVRQQQPLGFVVLVAALMALAMSYHAFGALFTARTGELFAAISMCLFGVQKLVDPEPFQSSLARYDFLAERWAGYGVLCAWAQTIAGVLIIAGALTWLAVPVALTIGAAGTGSILRGSTDDGRSNDGHRDGWLRPTWVPADGSAVQPDAAPLAENLMMVAIAVWIAGSSLF